ncbi:alpha/beta fold hydrolase [uncultured Piscinibacter sp.]|uniref:alpha/beta hydrolase n=1 Tax=uncultured Piscinibacter sp. TaxID=1131835 RepID=UPI00260CB073|nr:alpha/beta fold hydrolase [uncultured Piscinibacter sp.]
MALRPVLAALAIASLLYAALLALLWVGQERLIFLPTPLPQTQSLAREPDVHERFVDVDGARLSVLELRLPDPKGVVFFLHGNAGNLASWFVHADFYRRANYDLVMLDYRGYGKSSGRIESEAQLHADVRAVWQQVAPRYAGRRIVFYGRSLGTGLAAALAAQVQPDLTLLVSPFESMSALARQHYPWVPPALLRYPLRTDERIGRIRTPVLLLHGDRDELVPLAHSLALRERAPGARLVVVPGAGHNDLHQFKPYLDAAAAALGAL